ncbi:tyrosine-type recombinase/integrase [Nocardia sp. NPDC050408]|uniref:tyrosine-type recombinase/integrase n=1 Tax=Nocardia sp. NPDC050408 TaxID=3364319 RepID=UPI0037A1607C
MSLGAAANLRCLGEGRKHRAVPLTTPTQRVLRVWTAERAGEAPQPLFPTRTGRRLSADAIERLVRRHATTAAQSCPSIRPADLHPHVLRHSCAMALLHAGVDTAVIALWLGHADIRSTGIYLHADMTIKQRALDQTILRKRLGHDLAEHHRLLPRFVAYLGHIGAPTVTINAAMDWALAPEVDAATSNPARRMTIARRFAQHMAGLDPRTEVPPPGLISFPQRWHPPFIYTRTDLETLTTQARRQVRGRLPAATHSTMLGLLGATGLRVGEAIRLDRTDIDWTDQALLIRESKFGKSRLVPILPSTVTALRDYSR